jgi:mono/diheme cytochrome c family protein
MMTEEKDRLMDHEFDGIGELNNDLPRWWLYLFYFTILWAIIYLIHYHVLDTGDLSNAEYQKELDPDWKGEQKTGLFSGYQSPFYREEEMTPRLRAEINAPKNTDADVVFNDLIKQAMMHAEAANLEKLISAFPELWQELSSERTDTPDAAAMVKVTGAEPGPVVEYQPVTDEAALAAGKNIFTINCSTCHGQAGEGGIGPNMTDNYWLHGGGINNIIATIEKGVPAKGMIPWRGVLKPEQILQVASYLLTLQGTNPPNAKAPQGELYEAL